MITTDYKFLVKKIFINLNKQSNNFFYLSFNRPDSKNQVICSPPPEKMRT